MLQPVKADYAQWYLNIIVGAIRHNARRTFSNAREDAQQAQLVGRGFIVIHNNVPQQWQAAGAVIRHGENQRLPGNVATRLIRRGKAIRQRHCAAFRVFKDFVCADAVKVALSVLLLITAVAQGDNQHT